MRPRWWRVLLVAASIAAGSVVLSSGLAVASAPVTGSATVEAQGGGTGPPLVFLMTGALPLPIPLPVGNLNTACYGPTSPCDWLAQDPTGATVGSGTCTFTNYTVAATTQPPGTWSLAYTGTTAQGTATSFNFTVDAAITASSSSMSDGGSWAIQYTGAYEAS